MLHFILSEDWFRTRKRERSLEADFRKRFRDAERSAFDCEENFSEKEIEMIRELLSGGLFATPRILFLRAVGSLDETHVKKLKAVLEDAIGLKEMLVVASHVGKGKKTHSLIAWLLKKADSKELKPFTPLESRRYAEGALKEINGKIHIEPKALDLLLTNTQGDTGKLFQELSKLSLYREGTDIKEEDVKLLTEAHAESNIFAAFDALVQGKKETALVLLRHEESLDAPAQKTLGLCAWQLRRLIEIQELSEDGKRPAAAIARELKTSPYMIQKTLPHLKRFPVERLKQGISLLAELDKGIRIGRVEPAVALDLFVWRF